MNIRDKFKDNLILYHGPINIDLISFLGNYIKEQIHAKSVVIGKIYKVFIELTQNVSYYSAEQNSNVRSFGSGVGFISLDDFEKYFTLSTGNIIFKEHAPILERNGNEINSLQEDALRELKRTTRGQAGNKDIGAHIGMIQMGLLTGNALEINIDPINSSHAFFTIKAKVNK